MTDTITRKKDKTDAQKQATIDWYVKHLKEDFNINLPKSAGLNALKAAYEGFEAQKKAHEAELENAQKSGSSNKEPAMTARERLLKKAESGTAQKCRDFLHDFKTPFSKKGEKGFFIKDSDGNDLSIKSNERSARMYCHYILAVLYADNLLPENIKQEVEKNFPNE